MQKYFSELELRKCFNTTLISTGTDIANKLLMDILVKESQIPIMLLNY